MAMNVSRAVSYMRPIRSRAFSLICSSQLKFQRLVVPIRYVSKTQPLLKKEELELTFCKVNGEKITTKCKEGDSILDVVVNNDIDLDGYGACEGTLTCSTCHLILKKQDYDRLPEKPTDEELDMLDLAYDLTDTSRLGCQITMSKELNGLEVQVPASVNDARS